MKLAEAVYKDQQKNTADKDTTHSKYAKNESQKKEDVVDADIAEVNENKNNKDEDTNDKEKRS